jgi:hypothetical protein
LGTWLQAEKTLTTLGCDVQYIQYAADHIKGGTTVFRNKATVKAAAPAAPPRRPSARQSRFRAEPLC